MQVPVASLLRRPVNKAHSVFLAATPNMGSFLTRPVRSKTQKAPKVLVLSVCGHVLPFQARTKALEASVILSMPTHRRDNYKPI
jgi:hypothetical protein